MVPFHSNPVPLNISWDISGEGRLGQNGTAGRFSAQGWEEYVRKYFKSHWPIDTDREGGKVQIGLGGQKVFQPKIHYSFILFIMVYTSEWNNTRLHPKNQSKHNSKTVCGKIESFKIESFWWWQNSFLVCWKQIWDNKIQCSSSAY